jgi:hypothetical protein
MRKLMLEREISAGPCWKYPMRVFLSLCKVDGGFRGFVREHNAEKNETETIAHAVGYDNDFNLIYDVDCGIANDARVQGRGYSFVSVRVKPDRSDCQVFLRAVHFQSSCVGLGRNGDKDAPINFNGYSGKNWVPFWKDGLAFIRSLDPLVIVTCDEGDAEYTGRPINVTAIFGDGSKGNVGQYRGGGAARYQGENLVGYGHRTRNADWHTPFRYVITPDWEIKFEDLEMPGSSPITCGIVDPTCHWIGDDDRERVILCCTGKAWMTNQPVHHGVYRLED